MTANIILGVIALIGITLAIGKHYAEKENSNKTIIK